MSSSHSLRMPELVEVFKTAVTTGLDGTRFACLDPDVGIVCRTSVLERKAWRRFFECGGGVRLCSLPSSLTAPTYGLVVFPFYSLPYLFLLIPPYKPPNHCTHSFTLRFSLRVFDYIHSDAI